MAAPIFHGVNRSVTRLWVSFGVRLARLEASFAIGPQVRSNADKPWKRLPANQLTKSS